MRRHFNVISTATTQFSGIHDPLTVAPTPSDYVEHYQVQTGSRTVPQTGSTNNLATETDIDAISVAIPMFWGKVFTGVYVVFARHFLPHKFQDGHILSWHVYCMPCLHGELTQRRHQTRVRLGNKLFVELNASISRKRYEIRP